MPFPPGGQPARRKAVIHGRAASSMPVFFCEGQTQSAMFARSDSALQVATAANAQPGHGRRPG